MFYIDRSCLILAFFFVFFNLYIWTKCESLTSLKKPLTGLRNVASSSYLLWCHISTAIYTCMLIFYLFYILLFTRYIDKLVWYDYLKGWQLFNSNFILSRLNRNTEVENKCSLFYSNTVISLRFCNKKTFLKYYLNWFGKWQKIVIVWLINIFLYFKHVIDISP